MQQQAQRKPMTDWGVEGTVVCLRHCMTKKQLAEEAGVPYDSLMKAVLGKRAGHITKEAVGKVMGHYESVSA